MMRPIAYPGYGLHTATPSGSLLRNAAADLSVAATFASVGLLFTLSAFALEMHGIPYLSAGGNPLLKFHPATYAACAAFALRCIASGHPFRTAWRLAISDGGVALLVLAVGLMAMVGITAAQQPFTPLIDTLLLPCVLFLLLRDLDARVLRWLALLVLALLTVNAIVALAELTTGWRLVNGVFPDDVFPDPTRPDAQFNWMAELLVDWRATALLGHPLINGLAISVLVICLLARGSRWIPLAIALPLAGLQYLSLFAFGARTAMVTAAVGGLAILTLRAAAAVSEGKRIAPRYVVLGLATIAIAAVGAAVLFDAGTFTHTLERFSDDAGSAETRRTMFELFNDIPLSDILLVPDPEQVATLQKFYGLEFGIESSWVGLTLFYGLSVAVCLALGLLAFAYSVVRRCGSGAVAAFIVYFVQVSSAANLTTKVTTLAMTVCIVMLTLPRQNRQTIDAGEKRWR